MAVAVVTFADCRMSHTHRRFRSQAAKMRSFDHIWTWTEKDLEPEFRERFSSTLAPTTRGFGYFVWKPQVILQALAKLEPGDLLVYVDSGSHFNARGRGRLMDYLRLTRNHRHGILAFSLNFKEVAWTKKDLLVYFSVQERPEIFETNQIQAGAIVVEKRTDSARFFEKWLSVFEEAPHLVDDSPSESPEDPRFVAHRHDQSVFSILAKQEEILLLPASEQFPEPGLTWKDLFPFPIHHRRDKATRMAKVLEWAKENSTPFQKFLVNSKALVLRLVRAR